MKWTSGSPQKTRRVPVPKEPNMLSNAARSDKPKRPEETMTRFPWLIVAGAFCAALAASPAPAAAEGKKMVVAAPGIPPIFASVILYVAEKQGFFKKYGVDAEVR